MAGATPGSSASALSLVQQFVEFVPDAMLCVGADGRIGLINSQAERVFGYRREELVGQPVEVLVPPRYRGGHVGHRAGYFGEPRTRPMGAGLDLYALRKDGSEFPVEISLSPMQTDDGVLTTAAVRDISERIDTEREREALEAQIRQARAVRMESIGQLAGGVAHDFNNLLAVILNYADFAAEELEDRPEVREDVNEIRQAAQKAADLTRQLLLFSRREVVKPGPLDVNDVVGNMESLLRRTLGNHIQLHANLDPNLPTVMADPGEMEQVVVNLAVNARDAMPEGGRLHIRTTDIELDGEYARLHPEVEPGHYVELTVEDTGSGMSREVMTRAFEPFFTTKPKEKGTGLGLATVYGIARQAGGSVNIYSEHGRGTAVKVYVPATSRPVTDSDAESAGPPEGRGETILVVEDEDAVRAIAIRILSRHGYSVLNARRGADALQYLEEHPEIDLLLTDVIMPEMLGTDLVQKAAELRPDLRVLYMSGYMEPGADIQAERGDLIEKPFSARDLLVRVREALGERM